MKPRWRAFGLLTLALLVIVMIMFGYIAAMGYFEIDREEVTETVAYEDGVELVVNNGHGDINVDTWDRTEIEIVGIKKTYFGKDQLKNIEMKIEKTDVLRISVVRERKWEWVEMDLKIHIPEEMIVQKIAADDGNVHVSGIRGNFEIDVDNGKIDAENTMGNITLRTKNGRIDLDHGNGSYKIFSDNGNIFASYVEEIITADTANGWIHIHWTDSINSISNDNGEIWVKNSGICRSAETSDGEIIIRVNDIAPDGMDVQTANGEIDITLPIDIKVNYTVDIDNGDVKFRGFGPKKVGSDTFGLINGGGPMIDIRIDNGNVFLRGE